MIQRILFLGLVLILGSACSSKKTDDPSVQTPEVKVADILPPDMAFVTNEQVKELYERAEKVDIIFYNLPISVNQEDVASVRNTVMYIMPTSPSVTTKCAPLGRLAWLADGGIIKEADIYVGTGCNYLLFIENNKPVAANALAMAGVEFFTNIISQVNQRKQQ